MARGGVIFELQRWKFNFSLSLIILIFVQTVFNACCSDIKKEPLTVYQSIHDGTYILRNKLQIKENNLREMLQNLSEYIINGIVETKYDIDKIYHGIKLLDTEYSYNNSQSRSGEQRICFDSSLNEGPLTVDITAKKFESLIKDSITAVRNNDYDTASKAINLIIDDNNIYKIVNSTYTYNSVSAFNVLLNLSDKLTNVRKIFLLYNAINNEMENIKDNDAFKYLILIENLNRKILQQGTVDELTKGASLNLLNIIRNKSKQVGIDFLRSVFVFKNSTDIKTRNELLNKTYYTDESLFEEIHEEFLIMMKLNGMYTDMYDNLMALTKSRHEAGQELLLYIINIFVRKHYDQPSMNTMKGMLNDWQQLNLEFKGKVKEEVIQRYNEKIKQTLSISLYNLYHAKYHCIKNVGLDEYLNAGGGEIKYYLQDRERRNIFTSAKCSSDGFGIWQIEDLNNGIFYFNNVIFNENMYAAVQHYISDRHIIWLWVPDRDREIHYNWKLELAGNYVYIKSDKFNEYLYGSSKKEVGPIGWKNGHVYTLKNGSNRCTNQYCLWLIEDCTHINSNI